MVTIATLVIIIQDRKVLLGVRKNKSAIGEGRLNGPGGKQEPGETLEACVVRETWDEVRISLDPTKLKKVAIITFYVGGIQDFEVHVYLTHKFAGEPCETESMIPEWCRIDNPNSYVYRMFDSDRRWFPQLVCGFKFRANVYYQERGKGFLSIEFFPFIE